MFFHLSWLRRLAGSLFLSIALLSSAPALSASEPSKDHGKTIGQTFEGEELVYDIGVWFFSNVAQGKVVLKSDGPNTYTATLTAGTSGLIDTLLRHRKDRYVSRLKMTGDGKRFVTVSFEKEVEMDGKSARKGTYKMDYDKRIVSWKSWGAGKEEKSGNVKIPEGMYVDDPIAAFYNFRFGAYGEVEHGREYDIASFPKEDRFPEIHIKVATEKELKKRTRSGIVPDYLADARIDKELFGSMNGDVEIRFTKGMLPTHAIAKGIFFFGDVKGRLKEVNLTASSIKKASEK